MNSDKRAKINDIIKGLQYLKSGMEDILEEETEILNNIPEAMRQSDAYVVASDSCECLRAAGDLMEEVAEQLREAKHEPK